MTQDPLFELTRSPQLNVLINRTKEFYENTITDAEFKESIKSLNSFRREFRTFLREQIKFNVMTPLVKEQTQSIEHSLEKIREGLEEMYSYFNDRKQEHIDSGLTKCKSAFEKLLAAPVLFFLLQPVMLIVRISITRINKLFEIFVLFSMF